VPARCFIFGERIRKILWFKTLTVSLFHSDELS
jgi:hypothetical protein